MASARFETQHAGFLRRLTCSACGSWRVLRSFISPDRRLSCRDCRRGVML